VLLVALARMPEPMPEMIENEAESGSESDVTQRISAH